ncbi:MAG TPA: flagellar basal body rod protein FlgF [Nevskiaceae bacterium]|nr:flagellar basal body rod protein FlgF [Nevskiaceae bacterium]
MDKALYVAMTGAAQTMRAQAANNHNLANASTVGFRAELVTNSPTAVPGDALGSRFDANLQDAGFDSNGGALMSTGRDLDVALRGNTWLAVQGSDGKEAYTRAGDLTVTAQGQVINGAGHQVLGDGGLLSVPPNSSVTIGPDGTVSVVPLGQSAATLATVGRLKLVDAAPGQLQRGEDGLMRAKAGAKLQPASGNVVQSGVLESSNVNLAEAMTTMISLARQYEMQVKMMHTVEDNATASASLVRMSQ